MLKAEPLSAAGRLRRLNPGRRGLGLVLVSAVLLLPVAGGSAATRARVNAVDGLNLRDAPSTSATVIALLPYGAVVDVLTVQLEGGWYEINADGLLGYAKAAYLDLSSPPALLGDVSVTSPDGVRLRAAPSTAAAAIATLPLGRVVRVQGDPTADGWYQIQTLEGTGWVDGAYLQGATAAPTGGTPVLIRWYGHEFDGGVLACGGAYNADDPSIAATTSYPCGTTLKVCASSRCVNVVVKDRGRMGAGAIDLSAAAFSRLATLDAGALTGTVQTTTDPPATPTPVTAPTATATPAPIGQ